MSFPVIQITQVNDVTWQSEMECPFVVNHATDIWRISISNHIDKLTPLWALLSPDEQQRANRYYREKDKTRFIVSRAFLRILLAKYLKKEAGELVFEIGENKKPHVKVTVGNVLHYNVSHSGNCVLIGISDRDVGIDVEQTDPAVKYGDIMEISYNDAEMQYVENSEIPLNCFYTLWTRKEALLKATAKGIDNDIKLIPSIDGTYPSFQNTNGQICSWHVFSFKADANHVGSVACIKDNCSFWIIE